MRFKIDWAIHIVGSKFTVFALFYFVFQGNFPRTSSPGAYIWRDDLTEGFCVTGLGGFYLEGLIHRGAYFRNFTVVITLRAEVRGTQGQMHSKQRYKLISSASQRFPRFSHPSQVMYKF